MSARGILSVPAVLIELVVDQRQQGIVMLDDLPLLLVAIAMVLGGWLQSRRVAETMSRDITDLNCGQGPTANLATAFLVLGTVTTWVTTLPLGALLGMLAYSALA